MHKGAHTSVWVIYVNELNSWPINTRQLLSSRIRRATISCNTKTEIKCVHILSETLTRLMTLYQKSVNTITYFQQRIATNVYPSVSAVWIRWSIGAYFIRQWTQTSRRLQPRILTTLPSWMSLLVDSTRTVWEDLNSLPRSFTRLFEHSLFLASK